MGEKESPIYMCGQFIQSKTSIEDSDDICHWQKHSSKQDSLCQLLDHNYKNLFIF